MCGSTINEFSAVPRHLLMVLIKKKMAILDFMKSTENEMRSLESRCVGYCELR